MTLGFSLRARILALTVAVVLATVGTYAVVNATILVSYQRQQSGSALLVAAKQVESSLNRLLALGLPLHNILGFDDECQRIQSSLPGVEYVVILDAAARPALCDTGDAPAPAPDLSTLAAGGSHREVAAADATYIEALQPVRDLAGRPVALVRVGMPLASAVRGVVHAATSSALAALAVVVAGLGVILIGWRWSLHRPLARLLAGIRAAGAGSGSQDHRIDIDSRDEIGVIAAAFNDALAQLKDVTVSRRYFDSIVSTMGNALFVLDGDGRVAMVNPAGQGIYGGLAGDMEGRPVDDILRVPGGTPVIESARRGQLQNTEATMASPRRGAVPVLLTASRLAGEGGEGDRFVVVATDITERREAEQRLRQAERMGALGNLAGGVAHNFNNFLLPIAALTKMVAKNLPEDSRDRVRLQRALDAAGHAKELVKRILTFGGEAEASSSRMDVVAAVRESVGLARATLPAFAELRVGTDCAAAHIVGDRSRIEIVVLDLVSNAVDALKGRAGKVDVLLSRVEVDGALAAEVSGLAVGGYARLSVVDTGVGMDEATLARVFDPFFTTKEVGQGTGLGLYSAYGIVTTHGGAMRISSRPGEGTTVDVYLPLIDEARPDS